MRANEAKSFIDLMRNSTLSEILLTSSLILPFYLGSWIIVLKQLEVDTNYLLTILFIFYILAIGIMKFYQSRDDKILNASIRIRSYIISRNWKRMSFERIKKNIGAGFDDELLESIIKKFPGEYRTGTIKGGKKAFVLLGEEEIE